MKVDRVSALRDLAHHEVDLRFAGPVPVSEFTAIPGVSDVVASDGQVHLRMAGDLGPLVEVAARLHVIDLASREPTLEETFLAQYGSEAPREAEA